MNTTAYLTAFAIAVLVGAVVGQYKARKRTIDMYLELKANLKQECHHVWGNWETKNMSRLVYEKRYGYPVGYEIVQSRTCTICNYTEVKTESC